VPDLISFDIDGTLVTGNGPGPITLEMVRRAVEHGHIIGSASDRPVQDQKNMWAAAGIEVSFTVLKHRLDTIKAQYTELAEAFYHIGDTDMDKHFAVMHGFEFVQVQTMDPHPWMLNEEGVADWGPQGRGPLPQAAAVEEPAHIPSKDDYDYSNG
jgi:hypothetical protein